MIPTVFKESIDILLEGIKEHNPKIVTCVGQAGGRYDISIAKGLEASIKGISQNNEEIKISGGTEF